MVTWLINLAMTNSSFRWVIDKLWYNQVKLRATAPWKYPRPNILVNKKLISDEFENASLYSRENQI